MKIDSLLSVVLVDNTYDLTIPPVSADFSLYGGLYRGVSFIETPQVCVDRTIDGGPGMELDVRMDGHVTAKVHVLGGPDVVRKTFSRSAPKFRQTMI